MGLTSALLQSYFVRYPLNPSSTLALPNTSRKPLLKHDYSSGEKNPKTITHKAQYESVIAGMACHIT